MGYGHAAIGVAAPSPFWFSRICRTFFMGGVHRLGELCPFRSNAAGSGAQFGRPGVWRCYGMAGGHVRQHLNATAQCATRNSDRRCGRLVPDRCRLPHIIPDRCSGHVPWFCPDVRISEPGAWRIKRCRHDHARVEKCFRERTGLATRWHRTRRSARQPGRRPHGAYKQTAPCREPAPRPGRNGP